MSAPVYKEFSDTAYGRLRKSLIRKDARTAERQGAFLEEVRHTQRFLEYMQKRVDVVGDDDLDLLADRMSEAEFRDPPPDTERHLYEAWHDIKPRIACRASFWGYVTWRHIGQTRIESSFLAANGGSMSAGAARIDRALAATGEDAVKLLDECVRAVLRRLGGLPEARGNKTVYVNCPLSRGWWRERFVREASGHDPVIASQVGRAVRVSQQYWEELVNFVVSRNSVFGSPEIRSAFVRSIGEHMADDPRSPLRNAKRFLKAACRTLSTVQASRELSVLPAGEVEAIVRDVVSMHLENLVVEEASESGR